MAIQSSIANIFIDLIPDMCFVVSSERAVLAYNQRARELLGLPDVPTGDINFYDLLVDDSPRPLLAVLRATDSAREAEARFKGMNGQIVDTELAIRKISGPNTEFLYVIARDVSEEKKKELDLLRFSNVVHYTVNPIQITDARGRMVYVNPAFEKSTGYSKDELIGKNPNVVSSGKYSKEFWSKVWAKISIGKIWQGEIENKRKDGSSLYTQVLISPIVDADGKVVGYLGSHRDITEQKQLEQQLMHSQKMESMGTLAAGIAHEVGNPLTSISSIVQVLQRTINDEFAKEKLGLVQSQVHRITKIIRDLVDFSRPSNYQLQPTSIVSNVKEAVEIVKMAKKARNVKFFVDVRNDIPLLSLVPDQISQVFINILLNGVDAMDGKEGRIDVVVERGDDDIRIAISDSGCGIDEDHLAKIGEPFFTTKPVGQGTGLGLWVSHGIIKSFHGDIRLKSKRGEGTTFTIILPFHPKE
ncbi:MAG: PAS domain S-box protein [Bacteroidetes bacterium]|nr:PAS domain S-box protein [Bacteroidota bacterium]MCW5895542.1 PAS domain S-box protein [Bacteroidota bacterium]